MSQSTDATLAYGYDLGEIFVPEENEDDDDVESYLMNKLRAAVGFTEKWIQGVGEDYWNRHREATKKTGVYIDIHCSCEYPMYALVIPESITIASRGDPQKINTLDIGEDWNTRLAWADEKLGLGFADKPSWLLYSTWC